MMRFRLYRLSLPLLVGLPMATSCSNDTTADADANNCAAGEKCDNTKDNHDGIDRSCLEAMANLSGDDRSAQEVLNNDDPMAKLVFKKSVTDGKFCPLTVADVAEELNEGGCQPEGTAFVSERSQILGVFTDYRAVTMYRCDRDLVVMHYPLSRPELAAAGIKIDDATQTLSVEGDGGPSAGGDGSGDSGTADPGADGNSSAAGGDLQAAMHALLDTKFPAIIAEGRHETTGAPVIRYYQGRRPDLRYFGSSLDMLKGTDLQRLADDFDEVGGLLKFSDDGEQEFVHRSLDVARNCAACHPGGGMIMKELQSPWVHWEPDFDSPMTAALVGAAPDIMGPKTSGVSFEDTVRTSFAKTNASRLEHELEVAHTTGNVTGLLKPLFCAVEFNTLTRTSAGALPNIVLDGDIFGSVSSPSIPAGTYEQVLADRNSRLETFKQLGAPFAPGTRETLGGMTFVTRAGIDVDYVRQLQQGTDDNGPVVDRELISDVRGVDFTRSVYSEERCDLLKAIGEENITDTTPDGIRAGIRAALAGDDSPAALELIANLDEASTGQKLLDAASAFSNACSQLDRAVYAANYVKYVAQQRKRAMNVEAGLAHGDSAFVQFFFPFVLGATMPIDDEAFELGFRLDPQTCQGTTQFVPRHAVTGGSI